MLGRDDAWLIWAWPIWARLIWARLIWARLKWAGPKRAKMKEGGGISVARHPPGRWYHFC